MPKANIRNAAVRTIRSPRNLCLRTSQNRNPTIRHRNATLRPAIKRLVKYPRRPPDHIIATRPITSAATPAHIIIKCAEGRVCQDSFAGFASADSMSATSSCDLRGTAAEIAQRRTSIDYSLGDRRRCFRALAAVFDNDGKSNPGLVRRSTSNEPGIGGTLSSCMLFSLRVAIDNWSPLAVVNQNISVSSSRLPRDWNTGIEHSRGGAALHYRTHHRAELFGRLRRDECRHRFRGCV